jgi:hypothetical protein
VRPVLCCRWRKRTPDCQVRPCLAESEVSNDPNDALLRLWPCRTSNKGWVRRIHSEQTAVVSLLALLQDFVVRS